MSIELHKRAVKLLDARIGIVSNNKELMYEKRYFESAEVESQLTNIHKFEDVPYEDLDAEFVVIDDPKTKPSISIGDRTCYCTGDFTRMEKECKDIRYSVFGNLGLFFRYSLAVLERYHGIYSFHASSMYIPSSNTVLLVVGGAGAGKTVYLLKGVINDWKFLSTEMTHLKVDKDGYKLYKGALYDNVRVGSLVYDFPEAIDKLGVTIPKVDNIWGSKIVIDLHHLAADDVYTNPTVQVINVRIESDRQSADVSVMKEPDKIVWHLYKNASEKLAPPWLMYEQVPVGSCDDDNIARARLETMQRFVNEGDLRPVKSIFSGIKDCLEGVEL